MPTVEAIEAGKKLAELYSSITIEQIKAYVEITYTNGQHFYKLINNDVANQLTGFGSKFTCLLCVAALDCKNCIYGDAKHHACVNYNHKDTYLAIRYAQTSEELLEAFHNRAIHILSVIQDIENRIV
jgi:hypothetical protein